MSVSLLDLNDEQIIEAVTTKYSHHLQQANNHLQQANKYKAMLDAYGAADIAKPNGTPQQPIIPARKIEQGDNNSTSGNQTFEQVIIEILSDGQPRLSKDLQDEYFKRTGRDISRKDFSSKLSMRANHYGKVKKVEIKEYPTEMRYWWGLAEWFEGDEMKPEYKGKIFSMVEAKKIA